MIGVINAPVSAPQDAVDRTEKLLAGLAGNTSRTMGVIPYTAAQNVDVLVIDRVSTSRRLPPNQGVGLARKIGADISLELYQHGSIAEPWLYSTDADAKLPGD